MSERPSHEPQIQATQRLSPQSTLFEALSCLLTQGLSCVPVGDAEPAASFLSARTLLQAWHDGLPGDTPISRLPLDTAASLPDEAIGADTLIDGLPLLLWLKDRDGRFLIVNRSFAEACGQPTPMAVIGRSDLDLWPAEVADAQHADDLAVMASGRPRTRVEQLPHQGRPLWFETFKAPARGRDGQIIGTLGFACDVNARVLAEADARRNQRQLTDVLATIGEGIWDWDIASGTVRHNRVWCQMLGRPEESLTHTRDGFLELAHPDDRSSVAAAR